MKRSFLLGMMLLVAGAASAQLQLGIKGGASLKDVQNYIDGSASAIAQNPMGVGAHFGVFLALAGEKWALQPEVLYSNRGAAVSAGNLTGNLNLNYLSVPVMLRRKLIPLIWVEAGPEAGFLYSAQSIVSGQKIDASTIYSSTIDLGVNVGLIVAPFKSLKAGARYYYGLKSVTGDVLLTDPLGNPTGQKATSLSRIAMVYIEWAFLK
ncbi:MAG: PorT family protein [Bacteroidetes bacterium]|nr:MAG: PorT family protein [Bacteroidota bacterium]